VKKNRGKVLRDIATEFNPYHNGNFGHTFSSHTFWTVCFMSGSPHVNPIILANVVKEINRKKAIDMVLTEKKMDCK
jgi:hypothetical protein